MATELCLDDAILLGPDFEQRLQAWKRRSQFYNEECIRDLSEVADESYAYAFVTLLGDFDVPPDIRRARRDASTRVRFLREARESWGLDIVYAYNWKNETTAFCEQLRWFVKRTSWVEVSIKLNRLIYTRKLKVSSYLLQLLKKHWKDLVPLREGNLEDQDNFYFDSYGLLHLTQAGQGPSFSQLQHNAFGRCRQPTSISSDKDLTLPVVNYYARHLTQQFPSTCFVLPATTKQSASVDGSDASVGGSESSETTVQLVYRKTWFMVIKTKEVVLFDPTGSFAKPKWWKSSKTLEPCTGPVTDVSGVLLLGYLQQLLQDPESFFSNTRQRFDVRELRKDIEEVVLRQTNVQ